MKEKKAVDPLDSVKNLLKKKGHDGFEPVKEEFEELFATY
jgi:hypothetical protein